MLENTEISIFKYNKIILKKKHIKFGYKIGFGAI